MLKYPILYSISYQQQQSIQQMGGITSARWEWNFQWRRPLFDAEIDLATKFLEEMDGIIIYLDCVDSWTWKGDSSGVYTVGNVYTMLMGVYTDENQDGAFSVLWKVKVSSKVSFFGWRLLRDRLPTKVNLRKRHVEINDPMCPFCKSSEEDAAHLFFSCSKILPLWWEALSWTNISGTFFQCPRQHFLQHALGKTSGVWFQRWQCWWISLTWNIWQH